MIEQRESGGTRLGYRRLRARLEQIIFGSFLRRRGVRDPGKPSEAYIFPTPSKRSFKRVRRFSSKEPGTIEWLDESLREGDVFYDIGANMGIYTAFAVPRVGDGLIYAFEPHGANFALLLETIAINGFAQAIRPLSVALGSSCEFSAFHYSSLVPGSSGSQIDTSPLKAPEDLLQEVKSCWRIDTLVELQIIRPPDVVKIDVDGNELNILHGMNQVLRARSVRTIQVESDPQLDGAIGEHLERHGYREDSRHFSRQGQVISDLGKPYPANVIYLRA